MRIILLSATMGNAKEIAKWVKTLNGKETKSIQSSWRPSKIEINYHTFDDSGRDSEDKKIQAVIDLVEQKRFGEKLIVFVHSKNTGVKIVKHLSKKKVKTVFHNASVSAGRRKSIEKMFGDPYSGLDVLVSTSTLSSGVNL
jgi:replicative superfamily II helicase